VAATVHDFVAREVKPLAHKIDETGEFNWSAVRKMGPLGLLGLNVPEEFGGAGVDAISAAIAIEELGWGCGSTALAIAAHNGLGCAPVALFGSNDLKNRFLPHAASGEGKLAALAITEPGQGQISKAACACAPNSGVIIGCSTAQRCGAPMPALPISSSQWRAPIRAAAHIRSA